MNFFQTIKTYLYEFSGLIYPKLCYACNRGLNQKERSLCLFCLYDLPKTRFHEKDENPVSQVFWGRVNIEKATSFFYFQKGSKYRKLIHHLKYKGKSHIGYDLGFLFGKHLFGSDFVKAIDTIVPVPLHPNRLRERGYNQSDWIANGLSDSLEIPFDSESVYRKVATTSQTKKTRTERWDNVKDIFAIRQHNKLANKHILLVDDVLTTGATLEACAHSLLKIPNTKVSIATLGFAN